MAHQAAARCLSVIFLNSHSAWQVSNTAPPASEPNSGVFESLLPWNRHLCDISAQHSVQTPLGPIPPFQPFLTFSQGNLPTF